MKTALFKLLDQTIIPHYKIPNKIKIPPFLNKNSFLSFFYPFDLTKRAMRSIPFSICSSEHAKDKRT